MSIARSTRRLGLTGYLSAVEFIRRRWADVALVLLAGWVLGSAFLSSDRLTQIGLLVMTLALIALLGRHRFGLLAVVVCFAAMAVAMHLVPEAPTSMFLGTLAAFAVAGGQATRRDAVVGEMVGVAVVLVTLLNSPATNGVSDIVLTIVFCTIIWAAALVATERGRQAAAARQRVSSVESARDADVAAAAAHERSRIAGELHDIVSHGLSIVVLQTVAARNTLADEAATHDPAVDRRLEAVESTARDALGDMRRLLDLLRVDDEAVSPLEPSVGLAQLPALVESVRSAGQPIGGSIALGGPALPAGLDATAYRIVQEALTNAIKHAPGEPTSVDIARTTRSLTIVIRSGVTRSGVTHSGISRSANPPSVRPGDSTTGFGLVGMRERVRLYDGSLVAGFEGRDFVVRVALPVPQAVVEAGP